MDVMLMLEAGSLTAVYSDFKATADAEGRGLTLREFVRSFLRHVPPDRYKRDALALTKQLIEIFDVIDVNGDASMEWSEFVSFCIEAGMAAVRRGPKAACALQHDARFLDGDSARSSAGGGHGFTHAAFVADLNALVVVEGGPQCGKTLRFLTPRLAPVCVLDAAGAIRANKRSLDMSVVAAFAYVPAERLMAVLLSSHVVGLWALAGESDAWRFVDTLPRPPASEGAGGGGLVTTLVYDAFSHTLVLGSSNGLLHAYSPVTRKLLRSFNCASPAGAAEGSSTWLPGPGSCVHRDVILSLCAVPSQGLLCSSCLDGTLAIWDTGRWRLRRTLTSGAHAPGGHLTKL